MTLFDWVSSSGLLIAESLHCGRTDLPGVGIPSLLFVNMGRTLQQLTAEEAKLPLSTLFWLLCFGLVSLVPVLAKEQLRKRFEA